jgi:predicted 3-demethylubiquinone-9 3-methyltransferase (glyoxalase superfamily)
MNPPKFSPQLVFNNQAEAAAAFYVSVFKNSKILTVRHFSEDDLAALSALPPEDLPGKVGDVSSVIFELDGQQFSAANGGRYFSFSPGMSIYMRCDTQEEIDDVWGKLSVGGKKQDCGWIQDKFGVSWQIVPTVVWDMLKDPDPQKAQRVTRAIFGMEKLDIKTIQDTYAQEDGGQ